MNTEEKLQRIRAKCTELLALAEKRTPGTWEAGTLSEYHMVYDAKLARHIARLNGLADSSENTAFIAACAGAAEAGWRATIAAIDGLAQIRRHYGPVNTLLHALLEDTESAVLTAWPDELL